MKEYTLSAGEAYRFEGGIDRLSFDLDTRQKQGFRPSMTGFQDVRVRRKKLLGTGFKGHSEVVVEPELGVEAFDYSFKIFATITLSTKTGEQYQLRLPSYGLGNRSKFTIAKLEAQGDEVVITAANATDSKMSEDRTRGVDLVARNVFDQDDVTAPAEERPVNITVVVDESVSSQLAFNENQRQAMGYLVTGILGNKNWNIAVTTSSQLSGVHHQPGSEEMQKLIAGRGTGQDAYLERKEVGWTRDVIAEFGDLPGSRFLVISDSVPAWTEEFEGDAHVICKERPEFPTKARFTVLTQPLESALLANSHQGFINAVKEIGHSLRLGVK